MQAPPQTESHLWSGDIIRYYLQFPAAIPDPGVGTYTLLSLSPLSICRSKLLARLACLIHAANVHSEPESNPSIDWLAPAKAGVLPLSSGTPKGGPLLRGFFCSLFHPHMPTKKFGPHMVPVTIACRPKPKEINNQIVKDRFRHHSFRNVSGALKDSRPVARVNSPEKMLKKADSPGCATASGRHLCGPFQGETALHLFSDTGRQEVWFTEGSAAHPALLQASPEYPADVPAARRQPGHGHRDSSTPRR